MVSKGTCWPMPCVTITATRVSLGVTAGSGTSLAFSAGETWVVPRLGVIAGIFPLPNGIGPYEAIRGKGRALLPFRAESPSQGSVTVARKNGIYSETPSPARDE